MRKSLEEQTLVKQDFELDRKRLDDQLSRQKMNLTAATTKMNQIEKHNDKLRNKIVMLKETTHQA